VTTNAPLVIGMLGGMSWESSAQYYRLANELVRERLGGLHSARCLLASMDFAEIEKLQIAGRWDDAGQLLVQAAKGLEAGGADLLVLCTNTMHKVADEVQAAVDIPLLHLADVTARRFRFTPWSSPGGLRQPGGEAEADQTKGGRTRHPPRQRCGLHEGDGA
jgi:aspartate racemase